MVKDRRGRKRRGKDIKRTEEVEARKNGKMERRGNERNGGEKFKGQKRRRKGEN